MIEKTSSEETVLISDSLSKLPTNDRSVTVELSNSLINLLSDQLYHSPVKAIEELVVNSYDAEASNCCVFVPYPSDSDKPFAIVFDDGIGMSYEGLENLWQIGHSDKREEEIEKRAKRKQIGKFGIGKLAARTIADRLTYISKKDSRILAVSVDFTKFDGSKPKEKIQKITEKVYEISDLKDFLESTQMSKMLLESINDEARKTLFEKNSLSDEKDLADLLLAIDSWTIAILEKLTDKAQTIKHGTLEWVLSTAMPLISDFKLFLNGKEVVSSKESHEELVTFELTDIPDKRLESLGEKTGIKWTKDGKLLKSDIYPSGVSGKVVVFKETIAGQKSDDLQRSHGFFIKVLDRLVSYTDPLFGLKALEHGTFNRFRADIVADDLDRILKASRDTVEESPMLEDFRTLLRAIFNEADSQYDKKLKEREDKDKKKEGERNQVSQRLVEYPVADVLVSQRDFLKGAEADESWFYLELPKDSDIKMLLTELYEPNRVNKYHYEYEDGNSTARLVKFNPITATFRINLSHEFAKEYSGKEQRKLLENIATAEALLEVYLRQNDVPLYVISKVLEQRDKLLRGLAQDSSYSFALIAKRLRDAANDKYELEISLVVAARALGFNATHISNSKEPDGIAIFENYGKDKIKITLEAKSSAEVPSLSAIDFAGLQEHVLKEEKKRGEKADGCLLVAPSYPALTDEDSAAASRANSLKISCWTVNQLADVVEAAEKRKINAKHILDIVLNKFAPLDVTEAVEKLLNHPEWHYPELYQKIIQTISKLTSYYHNPEAITVDSIHGGIGFTTDSLKSLTKTQLMDALKDMEGVSRGGMRLEGENVVILVSLDELERKLDILHDGSTKPRRISSFRQDD